MFFQPTAYLLLRPGECARFLHKLSEFYFQSIRRCLFLPRRLCVCIVVLCLLLSSSLLLYFVKKTEDCSPSRFLLPRTRCYFLSAGRLRHRRARQFPFSF